MRKVFVVLFLTMMSVLSYAQNTTAQMMERRYNLIVNQVGPAGLGVETVLNAWEKADSTDINMLFGRFRYYLAKAESTSIVTKFEKKYLGMNPILQLKDSLDRTVYYYQEISYDDELFGQAMKQIDKAIQLYPDRLDLRTTKANMYMSYEKGSPDMALSYLKALADEGAKRSKDWNYEGEMQNKEFFVAAMQEYCYSFFAFGTPSSKDAFLNLSQHLNKLFPDQVDFINNIGSYYLVSEDYKTALKYYSKVLKVKPDDSTAIQNSVLAARKMANKKLEIKYLQMIMKYSSDIDALSAKARIEALNRK